VTRVASSRTVVSSERSRTTLSDREEAAGMAFQTRRVAARLRVFLTLAFVSAAVAGLPAPARAFIDDCTPGSETRGRYFDGMRSAPNNYRGASMHTVVRLAGTCNDSSVYNPASGALGNFSTAWSMLASGNLCLDGFVSVPCGWMQSGHFRNHGGAIMHFSQIKNYQQWNGEAQTVFGPVIQPGEIHQYWQQWAPDAEGEYHSNYDTTRLINTAQGLLTHGWTSYRQSFFAEVPYLSNDVPGKPATHAPHYNLQVQPAGSSSFVLIPNPFLTGFNYNPSRWNLSPTSSTSFDTWTS